MTVPSTISVISLMGAEKPLALWPTPCMTMVSEKLPTLDPGEAWNYSADVDYYASEPYQTTKTKKVMKNHVKAEATNTQACPWLVGKLPAATPGRYQSWYRSAGNPSP